MRISTYRCAVCKLEIRIEGEIVAIKPNAVTNRSRCLMSGDRVPLMCPALHRTLVGRTNDKLQ